MINDIAFFGDPHGNFDPLKDIGRLPNDELPTAVVMMGDYDPVRPVADEIDSALRGRVACFLIHGNHDADSEEWHDRTFDERTAAYNISCRVVEVGGIRIAGLGGIFRGQIWNPKDGEGIQNYSSRQEWIWKNSHQKRWRKGVPMKHRTTIFPEDLEILADLEADVLVTHEAPNSLNGRDGSPIGFEVLDDLAAIMGCKVIVHGHHHHQYDATLDNGIKVFGTAKAAVRRLTLDQLGLRKQVWKGTDFSKPRYPTFPKRKHETVDLIDVAAFCEQSHPKVGGVKADIGAGWSDLTANFIEKVSELLSRPGVPAEAKYEIRDIKEKYGSIRIYGSLYDVDDDDLYRQLADEIEKLEDAAENLSEKICDCCGSPGELRDHRGQMATRCEEHQIHKPENIIPFPGM